MWVVPPPTAALDFAGAELQSRRECLHIEVHVQTHSPQRWSVVGALVLLIAALSCGGGSSRTATPTPTTPGVGGTSAQPGAASTAQICACVPGEPASTDFRHEQKHVGLSGPTGQEITVGTILTWAVGPNPAFNAPRTGLETQMFHISHAWLHFVWLVTGDCDIHMEISDSADPNAARVIVETPVDGVYCPARQNLQSQLSAHGVPISASGFDLKTPLPVDVLGLAFQDYNHERGTSHITTPWEIHPAIVNVLPQ
jgi:hypothetical protein